MIYKREDYVAVLSMKRKSLKWRLRMISCMYQINVDTMAANYSNNHNEHRRRPRNRHRNRGFAVGEMDHLDDSTFARMFRLDRPTFVELVERLEPLLKRDETKATNSSGSHITTETRLAVTLRWLAGGSSIDLCFAWGIAKSSFYSERGVLWPTIEALDTLFSIGFPLDNVGALSKLSEEFRNHSNGAMNGCVLAIDGLAVRVRAPYKSETENTRSWRNRKGGFALVVMAGSDVRGKFHMATADHSGSTNDSIVWENCMLSTAIAEGRLDERFFIIGDEAFSNSQQVLSPYPGRGLGQWKDAFNYWLSHSRQCIERAFGMLTMRWGIFWRKFMFAFERWSTVIMVCMKLHNVCVDRNVPVPIRRYHEDQQSGDSWEVDNNSDPVVDAALRLRSHGDRRANITQELKNEGRGRPMHAECNSRA